MKKIFTFIIAMMASVMVANAQFGITAGLTSSTASVDTENAENNFENIDHYHFGVAYKVPLLFGFAVQPELVYQVKGPKFGSVMEGIGDGFNLSEQGKEFEFDKGFAQLGVGFQWGLNLIIARPYVFGKPFIGVDVADFSDTEDFMGNFKNVLEYGFSIGAGVEAFSHVQLSVEFYKNLGNLFENGELNANTDAATEDITNLDTYGGFKVTLGIFF